MIKVLINENTVAGRRILEEIAKNPQIGQVHLPESGIDEDAKPSGYITVDEYFSKLKTIVGQKY